MITTRNIRAPRVRNIRLIWVVYLVLGILYVFLDFVLDFKVVIVCRLVVEFVSLISLLLCSHFQEISVVPSFWQWTCFSRFYDWSVWLLDLDPTIWILCSMVQLWWEKLSQKTNKPGFIDLWSSVFWATETEMRGAAGYSLMPCLLFVLLPSLLF